jgi:serine/threonine protein kinase
MQVDESSIQKQQLLGRGKWGAVYRATYRQQLEDGQSVSKVYTLERMLLVALTITIKATALKEAQYNITKSKPPLSCLKEFMREIKMLTAVQHSHITAIEGVVMQVLPLGFSPRVKIAHDTLCTIVLSTLYSRSYPCYWSLWKLDPSPRTLPRRSDGLMCAYA